MEEEEESSNKFLILFNSFIFFLVFKISFDFCVTVTVQAFQPLQAVSFCATEAVIHLSDDDISFYLFCVFSLQASSPNMLIAWLIKQIDTQPSWETIV